MRNIVLYHHEVAVAECLKKNRQNNDMLMKLLGFWRRTITSRSSRGKTASGEYAGLFNMPEHSHR
jgi:hypothetical protein